MPSPLLLIRLFIHWHRNISRLWRLGLSLFLGIGIACVLALRANAADTVLLQYFDRKLLLPRTELQAFANDGTISPQLAAFLERNREKPEDVREWLTTEISPGFGSVLPEEFVLLQIEKTLGDPLGREDLEPLKTALINAYRDDRAFSVMEVLENYPQKSVRLTLSSLERVYTNVELFVTRLNPVLAVTKQLLPELVCNCNLPVAANTLNPAITNAAVEETLAVEEDTDALTNSPIEQTSELEISKPIDESKNRSNQTKTALAYNQAHNAIQTAFTIADIGANYDQIYDQTYDQTYDQIPAQFSASSPAQLAATQLSASANPSSQNKQLVLAFGPFRPSITVGELTRFAETGELSRGWQFYFNIANVNREAFRTALTQQIKVNALSLDRQLNGLIGEFALYEIGQLIQTPSGQSNIQALRSATMLSALPDNQISALELLQNYPLQQVQLNGIRLARLAGTVNRLRAGGIAGAVTDLEGWLVQIQASAAADLCDCDAVVSTFDPLLTAPIPQIPANVAQYLPANWQPVAPHRQDRGNIKVVWQQGTPYEMGYQHGQLLHDEIGSLGENVFTAARLVGRGLALGNLAMGRTYPNMIEECQGLVAATQDLGITMDVCMVMAYADVFQEILGYTLPQELFWEGCNQFVATGNATVDGRLYHGSSVDNDKKPVPYVINNSVIFVRQPNEGLPHVFVSYPGAIWPNSGMNVAGITLGLDTAHPDSPDQLSLVGRSNVQIMAKILETATSFDAARTIMETQPRVRANLIMITDGKSRQAGVFEFTGKSLAVRLLPETGVLYVTNHFVLPEMYEKQPLPVDPSSATRFVRFSQLLEPNQPTSHHGQINPAVMAKIGRDRTNPYTKQVSPPAVFDDDASPGGNGSLRQAIYDPERLKLWVAAGPPPVPENPFVCFSMGELLGFPNAATCDQPEM